MSFVYGSVYQPGPSVTARYAYLFLVSKPGIESPPSLVVFGPELVNVVGV